MHAIRRNQPHHRIGRGIRAEDAGRASVLNGSDTTCVPWNIFVPGGVTAAALFDMLAPNFAWANQVPEDDKRIATSTVAETTPSALVQAIIGRKLDDLFATPPAAAGAAALRVVG